ncbi:MAG: hypothetical protein IJC76_06305 [Lachnospiraceae bacterium]|nr:hypothetical protein [Lachnospiraceae bacterium]
MKFENTVKNVYIRLKNIVEKEYKKKDYEKVLLHISILSNYMYKYNLVYADKRLDEILMNIGNKYKNIKKYQAEEKTVVLYDWFGLDNRCLSLIYAKALNELGYKIIYITVNKNRRNYERIHKEVIKSGGKLYVIPQESNIRMIKTIYKIISKEKPRYAFLHDAIKDVSGKAAFSALDGIVERYQIVLSDHAFMLGTKAFDYSIEFRDIGYAKSYRKRKIEKEKLVILPFYPAPNMEIEFNGFPFETAGKRIIYSGGFLYKIYGKDEYFNMASYILDNFDDTIIYYTGNGDAGFLIDWIKKKGYENRFYYEPERTDLEQVIRRCYFFLNTYPVGGGLMAQYAIQNGKIPVSLADDKQQIIQLFLKNNKYDFVFENYDDAIKKIDELLRNKGAVDILESEIEKLIISEKEFTVELSKIMDSHTSKYTKGIDMNDYMDYKRMSLDRYKNDYKLLLELISTRDNNLKYKFLDIYVLSLLQKYMK